MRIIRRTIVLGVRDRFIIIIHFGRNPKSGGSPPSDRSRTMIIRKNDKGIFERAVFALDFNCAIQCIFVIRSELIKQ